MHVRIQEPRKFVLRLVVCNSRKFSFTKCLKKTRTCKGSSKTPEQMGHTNSSSTSPWNLFISKPIFNVSYPSHFIHFTGAQLLSTSSRIRCYNVICLQYVWHRNKKLRDFISWRLVQKCHLLGCVISDGSKQQPMISRDRNQTARSLAGFCY